MTQVNGSNKRRALIIGGSLGGLFAGNLLHQIGWDVDIFERSAHDLDSRGGGIVLQPEVVEVFRRAGVDIRSVDLGVRSEYRTVFQPDGSKMGRSFSTMPVSSAWRGSCRSVAIPSILPVARGTGSRARIRMRRQ